MAMNGATDNMPTETPLEMHGGIWFKREDAYCIGGGRGGKVRTCWGLARGAVGLVTAGSRSSPQVNIVAQIAKRLGIPCRVHTPTGPLLPEVEMARLAGAVVVQHKAGYNNVIIARAREDALERGWKNIPFGMECREAVEATAAQVKIPAGVKRVVVPVGSGMSLAGVLWGIQRAGLRVPVLGVCVGADPIKRLIRYAPYSGGLASRHDRSWREMVTLVQSPLAYDKPAPVTVFNGVRLDSIYEAKCVPFICPGDLFWVVGLRASEGS